MSPSDKQRLDKLEKLVNTLLRVENLEFIGNLRRRLDIDSVVDFAISQASINDLLDVDVPTPSNGQVLKYTTSGTDRWIAGTDIDT